MLTKNKKNDNTFHNFPFLTIFATNKTSSMEFNKSFEVKHIPLSEREDWFERNNVSWWSFTLIIVCFAIVFLITLCIFDGQDIVTTSQKPKVITAILVIAISLREYFDRKGRKKLTTMFLIHKISFEDRYCNIHFTDDKDKAFNIRIPIDNFSIKIEKSGIISATTKYSFDSQLLLFIPSGLENDKNYIGEDTIFSTVFYQYNILGWSPEKFEDVKRTFISIKKQKSQKI